MLRIHRDKLYEEIGRRIKEIREAQQPKLTQDELAKKLGVERTSITNMENGTQRATVYFLYSLAQQLHVPLEELLPAVDDSRILVRSNVTAVSEVKTDKESKPVSRKVKSFYERL